MKFELPDQLKRSILHINRFVGTMERRGIITYQDKIKWRGPLYCNEIQYEQAGNDLLGEAISRNQPLMVSRLGAVELSCLRYFLERRLPFNTAYSRKICFEMANNAGFFPVDDHSLDTFCEMFLKHVQNVDIMAVWFNKNEHVICNNHCPDARLIDLTCLEPFWYANPWSSHLAGKKVLVIHPFAETIRKQFAENRDQLFSSPDILPNFDLKTITAVQSIAGTKVSFHSWFDAYRSMCDEMVKVDFDICLIGAGAYGLPLASFAKQLGRQAVHLGGVTQILFGIKGKRWEAFYADSIALLFNEHWVRPLQSETPTNNNSVEKGCYW